jgi:hypothetical protein
MLGRRERGSRFGVRIPVCLCSSVAPLAPGPDFSVKEKDEASPRELFSLGFVECLHSPFCRSLKVFPFSGSSLVSQFQIRSMV